MTPNKTIIYINFAPYENVGKILDYLHSQFTTVIAFSFNFHKLDTSQTGSHLTVFRKGKEIRKFRLFQTPTSPRTAFFLLPLRSLVILMQILYHCIRLKKRYGPYHVYFTVNAFTAWVGLLLKKLHIVEKTIFWVWDYYPPIHKSKIVMFMRWVYWQFDKIATHSDRLVFLSNRLMTLRQDIGILPMQQMFPIVSIGTVPQPIHRSSLKKPITLIFIGVLKRSQGLDMLFDHPIQIQTALPYLKIHIIGSGPDKQYYQKKSKTTGLNITFHGIMDIYSPEAKKVIRRGHIGFAPYIPEQSNVSYYADPAKIKNYLSYGLPTVTTSVFSFSEIIQKEKAGIIIDYYDVSTFIHAVQKIVLNYAMYRKNAIKLAKKYYYLRIYSTIFDTSSPRRFT